VNGKLKQLLKICFKIVKGEDKTTKRNKLLWILAECLQRAFLAMHIKDSFARAEIYPFSKSAPLNSSLIRSAVSEKKFQPPTKKKKSPSITGKILTNRKVSFFILPTFTPLFSLLLPFFNLLVVSLNSPLSIYSYLTKM
jgi:hypothetical protein